MLTTIPEHPVATHREIATRLRNLAFEMDSIAIAMDYYGGLADWSRHSKEMVGAGAIARAWASEIEADNAA